MAYEYTQCPTLPHHHPQCPTLIPPHDYTPMRNVIPPYGVTMFHVKHLTQPHQYTQPYSHTITNTTRGHEGFTPESQNTKHTWKKGVTGVSPEPILQTKKTISFSFSSIIISPKKGGFKGEDSPLAEMETKSTIAFCISLYLLVPPCLCLLLFSLYLIVCL